MYTAADMRLVKKFLDQYNDPGTQETYGYALSRFQRHLDNNELSINSAKSSDIMEFLRAGNLSNSTQNLYLQVIKSLYRYAVNARHVYESPVKGIWIKSYKPKSIKQPIITYKDVMSFSSFLADGNLTMRRNRALLCAVFFCTLKISEALALKRSDFLLHEEGSYLNVTCNKAKNRHVSVPEYARNAIQEYIKDVQGIKPDEYLFCTFVGKSERIKSEQELKRDSARKSLIQNQQAFSGESNWTYNLLRQGGIIHRVRSGANLADLMQCTGLSVAGLEKYLLFTANFHSH